MPEQRRLPKQRAMSAQTWARHLVDGIGNERLKVLGSNPIAVIKDAFSLDVRANRTLTNSRGVGGLCDGFSFTEDGVITYAETPNSNRQFFTILHELCHHLVELEQDEAVLVWAADQPLQLIEEVCDAFAAVVLMPEPRVRAALQGGKPTGVVLRNLSSTSNASRPVCVNALARIMPCDGFVVAVKDNAVSSSARVNLSEPWARRYDLLPSSHQLRYIKDGEIVEKESFWPGPNGNQRFYVSAVKDGGWTYAVFSVNDLWHVTTFHAPTELVMERERFQIRCSCGFIGSTSAYPHQDCGRPPCPRCGECPCDKHERAAKRVVCAVCTVSVPAISVEDGICDNCA